MMNYIAFRVFDFFDKKDNKQSANRTIAFLAILEMSCIMPLFIIFNLFVKINFAKISSIDGVEYYFAFPVALIFMLINKLWFKNKFKGESLTRLKAKYQREKYTLSIWLIFIIPIIFIFILPIIYGALNGTLRIVSH